MIDFPTQPSMGNPYKRYLFQFFDPSMKQLFTEVSSCRTRLGRSFTPQTLCKADQTLVYGQSPGTGREEVGHTCQRSSGKQLKTAQGFIFA